MDKLPESVQYIFGYIRRSRQDIAREQKTEDDTLTEQRTTLTKSLENYYNYYDWDIYEEIGSGADAVEERPVFKNILEKIRQAPARSYAIFVKDISRLGRGNYEQMGIVEKILIDKVLYVITPSQIYDPSDSNDIEYLKFHMFFANLEYGKITRRMREARYTYASRGKWMTGGGGIPFGYKFNPKKQILEIDDETAWVVKKVYNAYTSQTDRKGYNAICNQLNTEGIPSPQGKKWKPIVVRRMLRNQVYIGTVLFRTTEIRNGKKEKLPEQFWIKAENAHDPIVSEEQFHLAAEIMEENKSSPKVKLDFEPQPLAGLIICSSCGNKMQRQYSVQNYVKKDGTTSSYKKEFMQCLPCKVYIKYRAIEDELLRILQEDFIGLDSSTLKERLKELIDIEKIQDKGNPADLINMLENRLKQIERELTILRKQLIKERITEEEYDVEKEELLKEQSEKEKQLSLIQEEMASEKMDSINIEEIQGGFKSLYDLYMNGDLSRGEKNEILRGIFDYVILEKTGKGKFNLNAYINTKVIINSLTN